MDAFVDGLIDDIENSMDEDFSYDEIEDILYSGYEGCFDDIFYGF